MDWSEVWRRDESGSLTLGPSTKSRLRLMVELVERFAKPGATLLDVGCGNGELLASIAAGGKVARLSGADVSDVPLAQARQNVPQADFRVVDICKGALPERFDLITCMMTLDLVDDDQLAAQHLSEMLKPGGHLLVVVQHLAKFGSPLDQRYGVRRHDRESLTSLLGRYGLQPVRLFAWGFPLFNAYYNLLDAGASDAVGSRATRSRLFKLASAGLVSVFRFDDLFKWTGRGRVLFGAFEKS
jgi:SAM-dependent methyltransferase